MEEKLRSMALRYAIKLENFQMRKAMVLSKPSWFHQLKTHETLQNRWKRSQRITYGNPLGNAVKNTHSCITARCHLGLHLPDQAVGYSCKHRR